MINKTDGKIGSREIFVLVMYMIAVELSDMTPTFLFDKGKTATWMIPVLAGAVIIPPFLVLSVLLKKYKNKGLIDIIYTVTGKYAGFIISMVLFLIMLLATTVNSRDYVDIIQTLFLPRTPRLVIYILLMGTAWFIASRGLEVIGRTAWLIFPLLTLILSIFVFLALKKANLSFLSPVWGPGLIELTKTSVKHNAIVGDIILLAALFPHVRTYKDFKIPVIFGLVVSVIEMAGSYAIYVATFDYPSVNHVMFPFHQTLTLIHLGRFFINVEAFYFAFWVIASVIRYAIYLYLTAAIFAYTLRLKEFEPLLLPFTALVLLLGMIPGNIMQTTLIYRQSILLKSTWLIFILLPFVLWLLSKIRGDKSKCKV